MISFQFKGLSRVFSNPTIQNINSSVLSLLYGPTLTFIHDYWEIYSFDFINLSSSFLWVLKAVEALLKMGRTRFAETVDGEFWVDCGLGTSLKQCRDQG